MTVLILQMKPTDGRVERMTVLRHPAAECTRIELSGFPV